LMIQSECRRPSSPPNYLRTPLMLQSPRNGAEKNEEKGI
jgi:hypothetical protein